MCKDKYGYAAEMLLPRLIEGMKERQESHENLADTKIARTKNNMNKFNRKFDKTKLVHEVNPSESEQLKKSIAKTTYLENTLNDRKKKKEIASQTYFNEESIKKSFSTNIT